MEMWIFLNSTKENFEQASVCDLEVQEATLFEEQDEVLQLSLEKCLEIALKPAEDIQEIDEEVLLELNSIGPAFPFTRFSNLSLIQRSLFNYFVSSIGPSYSLSSSQDTYLTYLTPMSFQFPALRDALIAASANQLRFLDGNRFERGGWSYKNKTIRAIQRSINSEEIDVGIIATVLRLCFCNVRAAD
jgi:hypothetical protein